MRLVRVAIVIFIVGLILLAVGLFAVTTLTSLPTP